MAKILTYPPAPGVTQRTYFTCGECGGTWSDRSKKPFHMMHCSEAEKPTHRMRRGKLVEIPPKWRGHTVSQQTKNARPSKAIHKLRKGIKYGRWKAKKKGEKRADD